MITDREQLKKFLNEDKIAMGNAKGITFKFIKYLRKREFYANMPKYKRYLFYLDYMWTRYQFKHLSLLCGFSIPINSIDKGLALPHYGTIVINKNTKIGKNCKILPGVTIGATNHSSKAASIGNNVFIGTGAKIIGEISIADDVNIGANAVVINSITEKGTTWAGIPAKKISNNSSRINLASELFLAERDV